MLISEQIHAHLLFVIMNVCYSNYIYDSIMFNDKYGDLNSFGFLAPRRFFFISNYEIKDRFGVSELGNDIKMTGTLK